MISFQWITKSSVDDIVKLEQHPISSRFWTSFISRFQIDRCLDRQLFIFNAINLSKVTHASSSVRLKIFIEPKNEWNPLMVIWSLIESISNIKFILFLYHDWNRWLESKIRSMSQSQSQSFWQWLIITCKQTSARKSFLMQLTHSDESSWLDEDITIDWLDSFFRHIYSTSSDSEQRNEWWNERDKLWDLLHFYWSFVSSNRIQWVDVSSISSENVFYQDFLRICSK